MEENQSEFFKALENIELSSEIIDDKTKKTQESCSICKGTVFYRYECYNICSNCANAVLTRVDNKDSGFIAIDNMCPDSSTRIFIRTNNMDIKRMVNVYNGVSYSEKVARLIYTYIYKSIERYNKFIATEEYYQMIFDIGSFMNVYKPDIIKAKHPDEHMIKKTVELFQKINSKKLSRIPVKYGVIAVSYYYAHKYESLYMSRKELYDMFNISKSVFRKGMKKINQLIKEYPEMIQYIDVNYWKLPDILFRFNAIFPQMSPKELFAVRTIGSLVLNSNVDHNFQADSTLTGIMLNCIRNKIITSVTEFSVIRTFKVSISTINMSLDRMAYFVDFYKFLDANKV